MNFNEVIEEWKKTTFRGNVCKYGEESGGPGYYGFGECELHPEVHYGGAFCPQDCEDFCYKPEYLLADMFWTYYNRCPESFNEKYHIEDYVLNERGELEFVKLWKDSEE